MGDDEFTTGPLFVVLGTERMAFAHFDPRCLYGSADRWTYAAAPYCRNGWEGPSEAWPRENANG